MIHFGGVGVSGVLILDSECAQLRVFYPSSFERVDYYLEFGNRFISNWVCPIYLILSLAKLVLVVVIGYLKTGVMRP